MIEGTSRFGGTVSGALDGRLIEASRSYADSSRAESLLIEALELDRQCLPVYFALYEFYFYSARLLDAERIVLAALKTAARQAGIPSDWSTLSPDSAAWGDTRSPAHFYLFTLKALVFIRLRQGHREQATELLEKLATLDSADTIGAGVRSLALATAADP